MLEAGGSNVHLEPGQKLSHYRLIEKIGEGGMGVVWKARDEKLRRDVALKVLPAELVEDPERRRRLLREARSAAAINHPNIAMVHEVDESEGTVFIAMELVEGKTLRVLLGGKPLAIPEAFRIATEMAEGLAAAHQAGVIHRDLKPENVMIRADGHVKILDFGLAKVHEAPSPGDSQPSQVETVTHQMTREGHVLGTPAYMSPEQARGESLDVRSDLFSFGIVLYEILTGSVPFQGDSSLSVLTAVLQRDPEPPRSLRSEIPADLQRIVLRCMEKDREARYPSAAALCQELAACQARLSGSAAGVGALLRQPVLLATSAVLMAAILTGGWWLWRWNARVQWARTIAIPEIERLTGIEEYSEALRMARAAADALPDDPQVRRFIEDLSSPVTLRSTPSGANVYVRGYREPDTKWEHLGTTPIESALLAGGVLRFRVELAGQDTWEGTDFAFRRGEITFTLIPEGTAPEGMVQVPEGRQQFGRGEAVPVPAFWLDRHEVTNAEYQAFVDAGGYRNPEFWQAALATSGERLPFKKAMEAFRDQTGRPGPATWKLERYPEDEAEYPVRGVSWYEAAAYAEFAGKRLPSLYHWYRATGKDIYSAILQLSNFNSGKPEPVGTRQGLGPYGTLDMAGNVREWVWNQVGDKRYILGGAWNEPAYKYREGDAMPPMDRSPFNGIRCMREIEPGLGALAAPVEELEWDFSDEQPVGDAMFAVYRGLYQYDPSDLEARAESEDDSEPHWRRETVSLRAAYGTERFLVHLYLPRNVPPPYQAVIYFPGSDARVETNSLTASLAFARHIPQSGRALIQPIYSGLWERRSDGGRLGPNAYRDMVIQWSKDMGRTLDYLDTRDDIDSNRIAFFGISLGARYGPILTAVNPRFQASILFAGRLHAYQMDDPPEVIPLHFAPRSKVPVVLINGNNDFIAPVKTSLEPMLAFQGAPDEDKKLVLLKGGHIPPLNDVIRESLDWLDRYLGPVER